MKPIVYEGDVSYKVESGVFKDICEKAKNDPENNYFLVMLDIALRRRFTFLEMMPDYSIIDVEIDGVNIGSLLKELNGMLSALIDRDHQIGHSYFCEVVELEEEPAKNKLYFVWYNRIIPLLQEYFYNDWEQLKMVLGDFVVKKDNKSILEDRLVSKNYEITNFENDWSGFSNALNKVYIGEKEVDGEAFFEDNHINNDKV